VNLELLPSTELNNEKIKISTYDKTNEKNIQNVTYFISISKNNEYLLNEHFFAQDSVLVMDVQPNNNTIVKIIGERQYADNAYVTLDSKYISDIDGDTLTSITPIQLIGPIFSSNGVYTFDIELRTIDDPNNWVYTISAFHYEINFEK
jgi:hypothetical protein